MQQDWTGHGAGPVHQRVVGASDNVAEWMLLVLKAHKEFDDQCCTQAESAGLKVKNLSVADIAYPLVTKRVIGQCLIQVCVSLCVYVREIVSVRVYVCGGGGIHQIST